MRSRQLSIKNLYQENSTQGNLLHKRRKKLGFLKEMDIFSVPIKTYYHKYDDNFTTSLTNDTMGSYVGGITSIFVILGLAAYFLLMVIRMYGGENDIMIRAEMANPFDEEYRHVEVHQENFLPHL